MREHNYSLTEDYYLVFKQGEGYWLQKVLRKGFGHVLILTKDNYNWIYFDPHRLRLTWGIPPYQIKEDVPRILKAQGYTVLKVTLFERNTKIKIRHSRLNNCVSFVKYALGLRINNTYTPYSLYKKLLNLTGRQKLKNGIRNVSEIM